MLRGETLPRKKSGLITSGKARVRKAIKSAGEPVSRILCAACPLRSLARAPLRPTQRGDHSSRSRIAPGLEQPTRGSERPALASGTHAGRASPPLLFGLAPRGVFRASGVTTGAVSSYPTFSPLPNAPDQIRRALGFASGLPPRYESHRRSIFCGTFRGRRNTCDRPLALPGALPFTLRSCQLALRSPK